MLGDSHGNSPFPFRTSTKFIQEIIRGSDTYLIKSVSQWELNDSGDHFWWWEMKTFPAFIYPRQASWVAFMRVCEWSQVLISNYLNEHFMSPITLPLTPCLSGHLDFLPYHKRLEPLPYHCMTDRSYHIMSTYLVTRLLVQAGPCHTKGTKHATKAF